MSKEKARVPYFGGVLMDIPGEGDDQAKSVKEAGDEISMMLVKELPSILNWARSEKAEKVQIYLRMQLHMIRDGTEVEPMSHERAMALVQALYESLEFGEDLGFEANFSFLNALRVAFPNLPVGYAAWPRHLKRLSPAPHLKPKIVARKLLGRMMEEWGKAIQDCVEGPEKES